MENQTKRFRKRDAILDCVRNTTVHPSADWVYAHVKAQVPDISLATVYRNLALFREQGLIASVGTVNGVERFDGNTRPHVHFICTNCACVLDLHGMQLPPELSSAAAETIGGRIDGCQLSFSGICSDCYAKLSEETA